LRGIDYLRDTGVDGRIILKQILRKLGISICTEFDLLRIWSCIHGHESSTSIKGEEFLGELSDYKLLKKVSAP
jgi:hypothetical protein